CKWTIRAPDFSERNSAGLVSSWMVTKPSSRRAPFAQRGPRWGQELRTLMTLPHPSAMLCPSLTLPRPLRKNAAPNSTRYLRSPASVTRSPCGIFSLALTNRSAVLFMTAWQRSFRLPRESRATAFCASIRGCWICGGTSWASATFRCGALGSAPGLKTKAEEFLADAGPINENSSLLYAAQQLLTVARFTEL